MNRRPAEPIFTNDRASHTILCGARPIPAISETRREPTNLVYVHPDPSSPLNAQQPPGASTPCYNIRLSPDNACLRHLPAVADEHPLGPTNGASKSRTLDTSLSNSSSTSIKLRMSCLRGPPYINWDLGFHPAIPVRPCVSPQLLTKLLRLFDPPQFLTNPFISCEASSCPKRCQASPRNAATL